MPVHKKLIKFGPAQGAIVPGRVNVARLGGETKGACRPVRGVFGPVRKEIA